MRFLITVLILCLLIFTGAFFFYRYLIAWSEHYIATENEAVIDFARGTSLDVLSEQLASKQVVNNSLYFKLWVKFFSNYGRFKAGRYKFEKKNSPRSVIGKFISGETYNPIVLSFTIPEGFTLKKIAKRLAKHKLGNEAEILSLFSNSALLSKLKIPGSIFEGFFYPATYNFIKKPTVEEVIEEAAQTFWEHLPVDYLSQVENLGLSLYQAVIFASLIELEAKHRDEKPMISEVIWSRLKINEPLGIDAAIIYGIEDYAGDIKRRHLQDISNLYNTRLHRGLPPTPICSPSVSSLMAVIAPSNFGYHYYVLKADGSFRHNFSKSFSEHNRHVRELLNAK